MPLDPTRLGNAIAAAVGAAASGISPDAPVTQSQIDEIWKAVGQAVVAEIQANAVVNVTGVQTGPGTAVGTVT